MEIGFHPSDSFMYCPLQDCEIDNIGIQEQFALKTLIQEINLQVIDTIKGSLIKNHKIQIFNPLTAVYVEAKNERFWAATKLAD